MHPLRVRWLPLRQVQARPGSVHTRYMLPRRL
jgi:hypothetical protein